jgi:acetyl-CoA acetyltransferase
VRDVYVAGIGTTVFGAHEDTSLEALGARAVIDALRDADLGRDAIEAAYVGHMSQGEVTGQRVLKELAIPEIPVTNVENACASGSSAFREAWIAVGAGMADVALVLGIEKLAGKGLLALKTRSFEDRVGHIMPGSYALAGERHMAEFGSTVEDLAWIAAKNRTNGVANPKAMYRKGCSVEEVLASRRIAGPLTVLQCCGTASGAAAVVLVAGRHAHGEARRTVRVRACALSSRMQWGEPEDLSIFLPTLRAARAAYEYAGIGPEEVDVVELHDAFSVGELLHYEGLMLCPRGQGAELVRRGATAVGGAVPVNPSGGLLARGHPVGATGVVQIAELVKQLRGTAEHHQIAGATVAVAQSQGGTGAGAGAAAVTILSR